MFQNETYSESEHRFHFSSAVKLWNTITFIEKRLEDHPQIVGEYVEIERGYMTTKNYTYLDTHHLSMLEEKS